MKQIVLLRGVNVGGRNKLPMKAFAGLLEGLGCENVQTCIQSGNAVVEGSTSASDIAAAIKRDFGFAPHVFVTSAARFARIVSANPFRRHAAESGKSVHLFLLDAPPSPDSVEAIASLKDAREDFALIGEALFLHTPAGLAASKIAEKIDRTLKVATTARNWNTVEKLMEMAA